MTDVADHIASFVDALLKNRRPPRFRIPPPDAEILPIAAMFHAATPGVDAPDPRFVERLREQLKHNLYPLQERSVTRRRLLRGFGIPAVAALVGATVGAVLRETVEGLRGSASTLELIPSDRGAWTPVMPIDALALGEPILFTVGAVRGFLIRQTDTEVDAISAVCTHLGCLLAADAQNACLDCPCHGAKFALDGSPLNPDYTTPLPRLRAHVVDGTVEVFAA